MELVAAILGAVVATLSTLLASHWYEHRKAVRRRKEIGVALVAEVSALSRYIETRHARAQLILSDLSGGHPSAGRGLAPITVVFDTYLAEIGATLSGNQFRRLAGVCQGVKAAHLMLQESDDLYPRLYAARDAHGVREVMLDRVGYIAEVLGVLLVETRCFLRDDPAEYAYVG